MGSQSQWLRIDIKSSGVVLLIESTINNIFFFFFFFLIFCPHLFITYISGQHIKMSYTPFG